MVSFGFEAVPELRGLLLQRERSGLYVARCRAVEALAALTVVRRRLILVLVAGDTR